MTNTSTQTEIKVVANTVEQTKLDIAKSMASQGYDMEAIHKATGLSAADVKHLLD